MKKVASAAADARERFDVAFVEVEVDTLDQLAAMLELEDGVLDIILLDNMELDDITRAVEMRNEKGPRPLLEASGGVELKTLGDIARTGVDRIAIGALTHHAVWLDIGLDAGAPS